jgi:hypothetical protein
MARVPNRDYRVGVEWRVQMATKLLVTIRSSTDADAVRQTGAEILAEYPDSLLVRTDEAQQRALTDSGLEAAVLAEPPLEVAGATFDFASALEADAMQPVAVDPNRTGYFLVKLVGPAKGEWLQAIADLGGSVQGNARGYVLIVGLLPNRLAELRAQPWVEGVTPYRPALKVSPKLRPGAARVLGAAELADVEPVAAADEGVQVEISVFAGESPGEVATRVRQAGGTVLAQKPRAVAAVVPTRVISELAAQPGVQAIIPHAFPELHNDVAAGIIGVPADRVFAGVTLRGTNQIVAVADSGLDGGDPATVHADFAGRVVNLISFPTNLEIASLINDPPGRDDGPKDDNSGHGTHVAGSVLGSAAAAVAAGAAIEPRGIASEALLYFQAVEQVVDWKTREQLIAEGVPPTSIPPNWPPGPVTLQGLPPNLDNLFAPAYAAGARIHTNSWGAPVAGVYSENAREVDEFVWNHRDMLILFSAGNAGVDDAPVDGLIDADSVGSPATAKNCLSVGASENQRPAGSTPPPGRDRRWQDLTRPDGSLRYPLLGPAGHVSDNPDGMAAFSSRGPTDDGRIKPEVVAPGTNVLSARSSVVGADPLWGDIKPMHPLTGLYCWSGGTSMSTPLVAGAATLLRQHLIEQRGHHQDGSKPSSALLKALLVGTAAPMPGQFAGEIPAGPNGAAGFGRVDLAASVGATALGEILFADEPDEAVETGQMRNFPVQLVDPARPFKATLAWSDAPSPVDVGGLENQLYLQVVTPDDTVVDGDVTAFPTATNNVQQVAIPAPTPGTYQIRVRGISITRHAPSVPVGASPRQDFALAVVNAVAPGIGSFAIEEIFVRRNRRWAYTIIGVQVAGANGAGAPSPQRVEVDARLVQGARRLQTTLPYYRRGGYHIWRLKDDALEPGPAFITVAATVNGMATTSKSQEISL